MAPRARTIDAEPVPESDRIGELAHPRNRLELFGHAAAAATLAAAARSGRMHHAWIIAGPKGVGKATLAWRFARALLAHGAEKCPDNLAVAPEHPMQRLVAALAHPDLLLIRRPWDSEKKRFKTVVTVDEVRRLPAFFSQHASYGGPRIAIVDAADDMNTQAQNALLKILEEPPPRALLLLVSHAPGSLLPTTRSRCRMLTLRALDAEPMHQALAQLAPTIDETQRGLFCALTEGAPGRALELAETGALDLYRAIVDILQDLPRMQGPKLFALAEKLARASGDRLAVFVGLLAQIEERVLRGAYAALPPVPGEEALLNRLRAVVPLDGWSRLWDDLRDQATRADALNLDKKQLVLNTFYAIEAAAKR